MSVTFKGILTSFSNPSRALALWEKLRAGGALGTTSTTACAGDDSRLPPGAAEPNTALGRDTEGNWVQRTAGATRTWLALQISHISGLVDALAGKANASDVTTALALKAPLASPALTGTPTVPTASVGTNTTQAASTAFALANIPVVPWYFQPSATGTGVGIATLRLTCAAPTTLTITGGGKFYTDSAGTLGETVNWNLVVGLNTIYVKVTSGKSACKVAQGLFISQLSEWTASTNAPSLKFGLRNTPRSLTNLTVYGSNTISGSLSDAPSGLTILAVAGSNTISGSLSDAPSGLTTLNVYGSNTISGSLSDAPSGLTTLNVGGSNTISGSLSDAPSGLTTLAVGGSNTCTYNTTSGSRSWPSGMRQVYNRPTTGVMTSAMIDALLIDLAAQPSWITEKVVNIKGAHSGSTEVLAAIATLQGYGITVTVTP